MRLLNQAERRVVEHDNHDRQLESHAGLDVAQRHAESAVTDRAQHRTPGIDQRRRHGRRQAVAHRGQPVRFEERHRLIGRPRLRRHELHGPDVGRRNRLARHDVPQTTDDRAGGQPGRPGCGRLQDRRQAPSKRRQLAVGPLDTAQVGSAQSRQRLPDRPLELERRAEPARRDRQWADVDQRHRLVPELVRFDRLESHADEQVGRRQKVHDGAVARHPGAHAEELRVIFGQHAFGLRRHEHRRAQVLDETADGVGVIGHEVEAEQDDGPTGLAQPCDHLPDRFG